MGDSPTSQVSKNFKKLSFHDNDILDLCDTDIELDDSDLNNYSPEDLKDKKKEEETEYDAVSDVSLDNYQDLFTKFRPCKDHCESDEKDHCESKLIAKKRRYSARSYPKTVKRGENHDHTSSKATPSSYNTPTWQKPNNWIPGRGGYRRRLFLNSKNHMEEQSYGVINKWKYCPKPVLKNCRNGKNGKIKFHQIVEGYLMEKRRKKYVHGHHHGKIPSEDEVSNVLMPIMHAMSEKFNSASPGLSQDVMKYIVRRHL